VDDQTAAGIAQWCRHFDAVTFYGVESEGWGTGASSTVWVDVDERATLIPLPRAYSLGTMAKHYRQVRAELRTAVASHDHLCFTLGNILGDWPAVAALEAIHQNRRFATWIDRVEPVIIRNKLAGTRAKLWAANGLLAVTQPCLRYLLRRSTVSLLQGGDTFDYYRSSALDPHCTYDTHTQATEQIGLDALEAKVAKILSGAPLRIVYVGRATAMKGPFDWLDVLERLHHIGVAFTASWIGDGPDLEAMRRRVAGMGLGDTITFPGFQTDRALLLETLVGADLLLFCHKTPESARCLIEALVCGCPIAGYDAAYPRRLVEACGGAVLTTPDAEAELAERVRALHENRVALAQLVRDSAASGKLYSEDSVYAHRADLMKRG
jgi:glycosyltransferase involved in cell wall biosynthesis